MSRMPTKTTDDEATAVESPDVRSLARRSLSSVREAADPRITPSDRPADAVLDEGYLRQLHDHRHSEKHIASGEKKTIEEESQDTSNEVIYVRDIVDSMFSSLNITNPTAIRSISKKATPETPQTSHMPGNGQLL